MCDACDNPTDAEAAKFRTRVDAGVAMLDRQYPGWLDNVTIADLCLSSPKQCVLGQAAGAIGSVYEDELAKLGGWESYVQFTEQASSDERDALIDIGITYGFVVEVGLNYSFGTQVWREVLAGLKLAQSVPDRDHLV